MEKAERTLREILRLTEEKGYWPSINEWDRHAKANGFLTAVGLYYYVPKPWERLREEMGYPPRAKKLTPEEALEYLHQASQELGISFTRKEYTEWQQKNPDAPTPTRIARRFGGWAKAMEAAGLIPGLHVGKVWSDEKLLEILLKAADCMGHDLSESDYKAWRKMQKEETPSVETLRTRFKSWNAVKEAVHLKTFPPGPYANCRWNQGEWLPYLVRFVKEQLSVASYEKWAEKNGAPSVKSLRDYAGTWLNSLFAALDFYINKRKGNGEKRDDEPIISD